MFVPSVRCKERPRSWLRCPTQREPAWARWECWPAATSLESLTAQTAGRLRCWSTTVMTAAPPTALMRSPFHWEDWQRTQARPRHSEWTQRPTQVLTSSPPGSASSPHLHPFPGLVCVTYNLDNGVTNPYRLWKDWGRPDYPTVEQFRLLRSVQVRSHLSSTHLLWVSSTFLTFLDRFHPSSRVPVTQMFSCLSFFVSYWTFVSSVIWCLLFFNVVVPGRSC